MTGFSRMTQGTSGLTPRNRQEIEAPSLLQSRQEIPLIRAQTAFTTLVTARADAYFLSDRLWAANVTGAGHTVSVCVLRLPRISGQCRNLANGRARMWLTSCRGSGC